MKKTYDETSNKQLRSFQESEKKVKEVNKTKSHIDQELHLFSDQVERESTENYKFTIDLTKKDIFGKLDTGRHTHDIELLEDMKKKKDLELKKTLDDRAKAKAAYMGMNDLQNLIKEATTIQENIEVKHVELQYH